MVDFARHAFSLAPRPSDEDPAPEETTRTYASEVRLLVRDDDTTQVHAAASDVFALTPVDPMDLMTGIVTLTRDAASAHITGLRVDTPRTRHLAFTPVRADA